ncbi:hypothetical protein ACIRD3_12365 [Kitasatospora sp. NPDC093550]|uniref:hypothetical protein n=1 Tax=Kitasatospora sp. NPDC093550 TaxID=3364089 RepID=UPI0038292EC3
METMGELDELRARVEALEAEVGRLREQSATTREKATHVKARPVRTRRAPAAPATPAGRDGTGTTAPSADVSPVNDHPRLPDPDPVPAPRAEPRGTMTDLADALGVMVSDQAEQTRVLRAHARTLETQSSTLARHGQFLESLLAGQAVLHQELRRENR